MSQAVETWLRKREAMVFDETTTLAVRRHDSTEPLFTREIPHQAPRIVRLAWPEREGVESLVAHNVPEVEDDMVQHRYDDA